MKKFPFLAMLFLSTAAFAADPVSVVYEGGEGPGKGKHVVLLAGDEEYRSEEAMPMLGKLLSQRHGFKCTVVFSVNAPGRTAKEIEQFKKKNPGAPVPAPTDPAPEDGNIDPNTSDNQPGIEALDSADLVIMSLRFRRWPAEQMKHFANYYNGGKPFIGLRTSTHAFQGVGAPYQAFNKFGKNVLGEEWVSHWARHKAEATRGVIEPAAKDDPLLRGVTDVFGDTDVYEAYPPADAKILLRGQVLKGMKPDDAPAAYEKKSRTGGTGINDPMMPVAWSRTHKNEAGKENKVLCTTMGSATDLASEGLRRLVVNGVYWGVGLEVPAKADVTTVGEFKPTMYGFDGFIRGVKPADHLLKK